MDAEELAYAGAAAQARLVREGAVGARELVQATLERIARLDPQLNAFRSLYAERALAEAAAVDAGPRGETGRPLLGVPIAIKDDTDVAGDATLKGSSATSREPAGADAETVRRLRGAGAIVVGKTHVPELTQWPFTETATFGATRNPWDLTRTPGGSSGGSAAAVAAGLVPGAMGSDGAGSIRIPAACTGTFGIKPQRGRVPLAPVDEAWHGLVVTGPIARRVADAALLLDVVADRADGEGSFLDAAAAPPTPLRVALSTRPPLPGPVDAEMRRAAEATAELLRSLGHTVVERDPDYGPAIPHVVARYLRGIHDDARALPHPERLERRTKGMARLGAAVPAAFVARSRRDEAALAARVGALWDEADVLLTPALAAPPLAVGRFEGRGTTWTFNGAARFTPYTGTWNLTGQPAVSVPAGLSTGGLPLGVQLVGRPRAEATLIALAAQLEAERPWSERRPPLR